MKLKDLDLIIIGGCAIIGLGLIGDKYYSNNKPIIQDRNRNSYEIPYTTTPILKVKTNEWRYK